MKSIIMNKKPWAPHPAVITIMAILFLGLMSFVIVVRSDSQANRAEVNQVQGILIFTDSRPVQHYEYLGSVKNAGRHAFNPQYQPIRDYLVKKIKKEYPAANGAIFHFNNGSADYADAIKLQE